MKVLLHIILVFLSGALSAMDTLSTKQVIRYQAADASEVFMVWGINNWQQPGQLERPPGTFVKDGLTFTPMRRSGEEFVLPLTIPQYTTLDFIFWISKGPREKETDIWDVNQAPYKDYHVFAFQDNITVVPSSVKIRPAEQLSVLDFSLHLLIFSGLLFLLYRLTIRFKFGNRTIKPGSRLIILSSAILLFTGLMLVRTTVAGSAWDIYLQPLDNIGRMLTEAYYDFILVVCLTVFFLLALLLFRGKEKAQWLIAKTFSVLCVALFLVSLLNIKIVEQIGRPFTWQWLQYSDFLQSADAKAAVSSNLSPGYAISILSVVLSFVLLRLILSGVVHLAGLGFRVKQASYLSVTALSASYFLFAGANISGIPTDYNRLSNPVVAFAASTDPFISLPALFTMEVPDSLRYRDVRMPSASKRAEPGIRNVVFFVLESTPAEYVSAYGSKYNVTPELDKYLGSSVLFRNVYAHAPATNNSMVSILGSVYPWLSMTSITQEDPSVKLPTLSSELKEAGYRTAFFNSADNRFQKADEFLACRKFDQVKDCRDHSCDGGSFTVNDRRWKFLDGKDDECTQTEMMSWIREEKDQPFFAMMWTYQTHYPYFVSGEEKIYDTQNKPLNRYLNAVHHSDQVFGKMMRELEQEGLLASTLVVVVGDHGEAFGRHDQLNHASEIYEENLHVPCMFIHPSFKGEQLASIGGLIDIAPTVMDLLGKKQPAGWQGKNLFDRRENDRVYFFAPWSDYLIGYREGKYKYIFNATRNETEIYDLENDPTEMHPINIEEKEMRLFHHRLAAWAQYVNTSIGKIMTKGTSPEITSK